MEPRELVKLTLARLPKPHTQEVTLHVFCEIERTPHLRRHYDDLVELKGKDTANQQIGKAVANILDASPIKGQEIDARGICEIVSDPSRLDSLSFRNPDVSALQDVLAHLMAYLHDEGDARKAVAKTRKEIERLIGVWAGNGSSKPVAEALAAHENYVDNLLSQ